MRGLNYFLSFNAPDFLRGKKLVVTGVKEWTDYTTKEHLGTKVSVVFAEDSTSYPTKNGEQISNLYEKLVVKVAKDVKIPVGTEIVLVNPMATVYGEYRNLLSVKADDVVPANNGGKQ